MSIQSIISMFLFVFVLSTTCGIENGKKLEEQIIAMEKSALDRWGNGDPQGYLEISAEEVTYFDPFNEARVNGLEALKQLYAPLEGKIRVERYEMINPKVQIHNKTAILTFNLISYVFAAKESIKKVYWNCTEVYSMVNGKWKIIHTHWSLFKPESQG